MRSVLWLVLLLSALPLQAGFDSSHAAWTRLLQEHVRWSEDGSASTVDYAAFARQADALAAYLDTLGRVDATTFSSWPKPERDAFLINAYNAATVQLILTRYPDLESIKEIGGWFGSPWKQSFVSLLGQKRSLDEIEHELLRGAADYDDPRIHFAVNCASIGCPALRPEAYAGKQLDAQLQDQTRRFLRDRSRNRYDPARESLVVSRIFDWYGEDFVRHAGGVGAFLASQADALALPADAAARARSNDLPVRFSNYDWRLNRTSP
jgi:hypothetical protein